MGRKDEVFDDLSDDEDIVGQSRDEAEGELEEELEDEAEGALTDETAEAESDEDGATREGGAGYEDSLSEDSLDEYDETDHDLKVVDEALSHKDQNARSLAVRRAIEERLESKRLSRDLDYLDLDD